MKVGHPVLFSDAVCVERGTVAEILIEPAFERDFVLEDPLALECGRSLARAVLHYAVYGEMNAERDNVVLVCHALSGSALAGAWWPGLFAPGGIVDLSRECVVCVNLLGSCYG